MKKTLSEHAQAMIASYQGLPFSHTTIRCPYFNNKKIGTRGALRVLIGKGNPREIVEEADMIGFREQTPVSRMNAQQLTQFLVTHNLGIDCAGFVYHVLDAELYTQKKKRLGSVLHFPSKNPIRKLLSMLRPAENTSVQVFAQDENSSLQELNHVQPGDMIIMQEFSGDQANRDHMLLIDTVEYDDEHLPREIHYVHSLQWNADGMFDHGIREGVIRVTTDAPLLEQGWSEDGKTRAPEHETFARACASSVVAIRRLRALG